jgi:hypothetical protein
MIVSINQPAYLPWLGYFQRIAASDLHVVLDHVQFEKNSYTNRNKIRTATGWQWLTVPVQTSGRFGNLSIRTLRVDNTTAWSRKHWAALQTNYAKAPYFPQYKPVLLSIYKREWTHLADLCRELTACLLEGFGIRTRLLYSSDLSPKGAKDDMVLGLCRDLGATTYLSGAMGRDYLHEERFQSEGIRVVYQEYAHPVYPQVFSPFESYMAALDLLLNCGPRSSEIALGGAASVIPCEQAGRL